MFSRTTLIVMSSALIVALLAISPTTSGVFPFYIAAAGLHMADTMAHEMGHTFFYWLFGQPAIPMIFTMFGADQAGGMSLTIGHSWFVQILVFLGLGYFCYRLRENGSFFWIPAVCFSLLILLLSFTSYPELIIAYMGHGSSIFLGGYLLFRAWVYVDWRSRVEHWLNALFGFFMTLSNFHFGYGLAYDEYRRRDYMEHVMFGITHNDFMAMAEVSRLTVRGIGLFTMGYCVVVIIAAFILAWFMQDAFEFDDGDVA